MATLRDLGRLALALPGTAGPTSERIVYTMRGKPKAKFAWSWLERVDPKRPRVENREVIALCVASLSDKEMLLASDPAVFFTEPHYNGYPVVLVRLATIDVAALAAVLAAAWRCQASESLLAKLATRPRRVKRVKRETRAKRRT
jgi:hypothetical protein